MTAIPAPSTPFAQEEWPDADFDLPDGEPIHATDASDKEDEDWDIDMDFGDIGGARALPTITSVASGSMPPRSVSQMFTIRPPITTSPSDKDDDDDDEGASTIKVAALPRATFRAPVDSIDEDFEDGFAIPSELTQLSLRPSSSLLHRSSKTSLEWGDKDQTSSSQSSDAYSTFGFADNSPSSNYTSASLPETETEDDDDEDDLDGLVIPSGLFESGHSAKKLTKLLEKKKTEALTDDHIKVTAPDPEDDFEIGLVIDNDVALSPSRLLQTTQVTRKRVTSGTRSLSVPSRPPASVRPPSRLRGDRAKSPNNPPISSAQQLRKLATPPSPPESTRTQTYSQALTSAPATSMTFLAPKPGSLRVQKSHSGLKPASPPPTRKLGRKASLPSLSESTQASGSSSGSGLTPATQPGRYDAPTASSRAKVHTTNSTSRMHTMEYNVPPTRPSTPSSNPAALRLTMPTSSSRLKTRTPISSVFPTPSNSAAVTPVPRSISPLPPARPRSSASAKSRHAQTQSLPGASTIKVLKKPKRQKTYGDGTELDAFEDLPLDREKEGLYRVQPKAISNRIPGATYPKGTESLGKGTLRKKPKRELSGSSAEFSKEAPPAKTLKRTTRVEFPAKSVLPTTTSPSKLSDAENGTKKKKIGSPSAGQTRRKPTLIRNLGGAGPVKVVGEMKWNPNSLRWEGNDQVLRDFDAAVGTSTRPALITHLTGSSVGSPVGSFAAGARVVGTMVFDPSQMRWISTLPPEEDEPDVFADLADDEDDDWEAQSGTIRASQQQQANATTPADVTHIEAPSPARRHTRSNSESESDRCSRASMVCEVDDGFWENCRMAEERHRTELKGWIAALPANISTNTDRSYLYEIRALATRQY